MGQLKFVFPGDAVQLELPFKEYAGINLLANFTEKEKDEIRENTKEDQEEMEQMLRSRTADLHDEDDDV